MQSSKLGQLSSLVTYMKRVPFVGNRSKPKGSVLNGKNGVRPLGRAHASVACMGTFLV